MKLALAIALGLAAIGPVQAQDIAATLRNFGLPGTWSEDCSIAPDTFLVRFSAASSGLSRVSLGHPDAMLSVNTVVAVERAGAELVLTLAVGFALPTRRVTLRREDDLLRVWHSVLLPGGAVVIADGRDAATGAPVPALHRCMSE